MIFIRYILILLSTLLLSARTVHEDAEDQQISRWNLINTRNSIVNTFDKQKQSRVMDFLAKRHNFAYELKMKKQSKIEYWISWEMQFSEDFVIIVALETNRGQHYLVYTSGEGKSHMQYGLGRRSKNGTWQKVTRNLQEDISYFDNRVQIHSVKSFVLRGRGRLDNIITMRNNSLPNAQKIPNAKEPMGKQVLPSTVPSLIVPSLIPKKEEKQRRRKIFKTPVKSLPSIKLKGNQTVQLQLGEAYVEPGVTAYDDQDGEINVVSMENIDVNQNGRYMILYMATDSNDNVALDKRYVEVGNVSHLQVNEHEENRTTQSAESPQSSQEESEEEEPEELDEGTRERNMQIEIWEKKLELKELELKRQNH